MAIESMMKFKGSVRSDDLPALVAFLSGLHQSGFLDITHERWTARLAFGDGRIIAASCGDQRGVEAIVALSTVLREADFVYAETCSPPQPEFELSVDELRERWRQPQRATVLPTVCPALGIVDDRQSFARTPTGLHRCFANRPPIPVAKNEQRDVCLAGRYQSCPRFQAASNAAANGSASMTAMSLAPVQRMELGQALELARALPVPPELALARVDAGQPCADVASANPRGALAVLPLLAISLAAAAVIAWVYVLWQTWTVA